MGLNAIEIPPIISELEIIEQRNDEKSVLESIYETAFKEKIANSLWIFKVKLEYLIKKFQPQKKFNKLQNANVKKKKELCRWYLSGNCKFGNKCKFLHGVEQTSGADNSHLSDYSFELEVRFPQNSKYPFEPPIIFLKTNFTLPNLMNMHICKKLYQEAQCLAADGIPSLYSVVELLKNEEAMCDYISNTKLQFLLPVEKLISSEVTRNNKVAAEKYYQKGITTKDNKKELTEDQITNEDRNIVNKFLLKSTNSRYKKMLELRKKLPAWSLKNDIINTIYSAKVSVICGETGCGKSTQVPQFLLDEWISNYNNSNKHVEIICTQPRRISTIGVAERVADERCDRVGNTIGYQIRLESKLSASTRLTFCTIGILLRKLENDPLLSNVSHIIVDEVHERSEER